jgi:hypothetical protein
MYAVAAITVYDKYTFCPLSCTIFTGQPWCDLNEASLNSIKDLADDA